MGKIQHDLVRQVLCEQQRPLLTARWAKVETLARKRSEVVVSASGVRASDASHTKLVVSAGQEPLSDAADAVQPEHAVGCCVLLIVDIAEVLEVALEDGMELIAAPGKVAMT